jgi:hypothetical protein
MFLLKWLKLHEQVSPKRKRVHGSLLYWRILIIYRPKQSKAKVVKWPNGVACGPGGFKAKLSKKKFKLEHILFFSKSERDFYSENDNVYNISIHLHTKNTKKK